MLFQCVVMMVVFRRWYCWGILIKIGEDKNSSALRWYTTVYHASFSVYHQEIKGIHTTVRYKQYNPLSSCPGYTIQSHFKPWIYHTVPFQTLDIPYSPLSIPGYTSVLYPQVILHHSKLSDINILPQHIRVRLKQFCYNHTPLYLMFTINILLL